MDRKWIAGPPPRDCTAAWITNGIGESWFEINLQGYGWSSLITHHIPVDIGERPVPPTKTLPLPRRFRGCWRSVRCIGVQFFNGRIATEMEDGGCSYGGKDIDEITDIEFIDE